MVVVVVMDVVLVEVVVLEEVTVLDVVAIVVELVLVVVAVVVAVLIVNSISNDGRSNWLEGTLLLATYTIIGLAFFFHPVLETARSAL